MSEQIKITIDGRECAGSKGDTILEIAKKNGIEIPTLCYDESVKIYGACGLCTVEVEGVPKLLRACASVASDGYKVSTRTRRVLSSRKIALELLMSEHSGDCRGPCSLNCPAGTDCQEYVKLISQGRYRDAVEFIKKTNPFPASIGRVCPHPCETACRRSSVEQPISIAQLKYFAADMDMNSKDPYVPKKAPSTGKKIAVIGGGPGGLSSAYFLALKGHDVTVFEAMPEFGGMLRYGIPSYRLPKDILSREIDQIKALGVTLRPNTRIGKDIAMDEIRSSFDATLISIGAWTSSSIRCKGEDLEGVIGGIDFLRRFHTGEDVGIGEKVAVVGGGNTAMDACRSAVRAGAKEVYVIYRRTEAEMPAEEIEIKEAKEEGVTFKFLTNPDEIIGENGKVKAVRLQIMKLGEPDASGRRSPVPVEGKFETLFVDTVIAAIGQQINAVGFESLEKTRKGAIQTDTRTFRTSEEGVFAIGDAVGRGAIAIAAIGQAHKAAVVIDDYLNGKDGAEYRNFAVKDETYNYWWGYIDDSIRRKPFLSKLVVKDDTFSDREKAPRQVMPCRTPEERRRDFNEVNLGFTEEQALTEAKRCLECGCHDYGLCRDFADCKLIRYANFYDIDPDRVAGEVLDRKTEKTLVEIERTQNKCILCGLCVRVCDEIAKQGILGLVGRGFNTVIKPEFNDPKTIAVCKDCLKCAEACPTGALKILK